MTTVNIDHILPRVQKPARYTGGEWNSSTKAWGSCDLRIALAYPDLYDINRDGVVNLPNFLGHSATVGA